MLFFPTYVDKNSFKKFGTIWALTKNRLLARCILNRSFNQNLFIFQPLKRELPKLQKGNSSRNSIRKDKSFGKCTVFRTQREHVAYMFLNLFLFETLRNGETFNSQDLKSGIYPVSPKDKRTKK